MLTPLGQNSTIQLVQANHVSALMMSPKMALSPSVANPDAHDEWVGTTINDSESLGGWKRRALAELVIYRTPHPHDQVRRSVSYFVNLGHVLPDQQQ